MGFIGYEIFKRKKSFNARALYAKFGTTKIRKLKKASMRRLKERKKRMKEESKKRREENRTKKEGTKKAGAAKKIERTEKKKMKVEEKKKRKQEEAELKKAKKEKKREGKNKKKDPVLIEGQISQTVGDTDPVVDLYHSCVDMPNDTAETGDVTPYNLGRAEFNYYPVASPDPQVVQDWRLQVDNSEESPV
ncbi:hypothetical protein EGW08_005320 [Elysia chlorotica]|uniref:Uncharacterized protein n=1 Tax=Elysia chlorotica TaxID=188477 RepID=A0A433TZH3_ELYCH|nr:hypothetical protein EGW08_005320 [Elysia chlorotica]